MQKLYAKQNWVIDSGASGHIKNSKNWFVAYEKLKTPLVMRLANGVCNNAYGRGDIEVLHKFTEKFLAII